MALVENYAFVKTQMDMSNFIDYVAAEIFFANLDWPLNNVGFWRPDTTGGKWRWFFYDLDGGFGNPEEIMLEPLCDEENKAPVAIIFRNLLQNKEFRTRFINRFSHLLNSTFRPNTMLSKMDAIQDLYFPEMNSQVDRWQFPESISRWDQDIKENLVDFLLRRPCAVQEELMNFFELETFDYNCRPDQSYTFKLGPNPNNGSFSLTLLELDYAYISINIYDLSGKQIYGVDQELINRNIHFNLPTLAPGFYLVKIIHDKELTTFKMVVSR